MSRQLLSFFGLHEMARPAGTLGKTMRAALEKAREYGQEFTVKQFCDWLAEAGVENPHPASVGIRLTKLLARDQEPDALHPLIKAQQGRRGAGGTGTFKYVYDGPAGLNKSAEPEDGEDPDGGEGEPAAAPQRRGGWPQWLPRPDEDGTYDQMQMAKLASAGIGSDHQLWAQVKDAENDLAVHAIIKRLLPPNLQRAALRVAQEVFTNLGKDWEAVAAKKPVQQQAWNDDDETGGSFSSEPDPDDDETPLDEPEEDEPEPETDDVRSSGAANFIPQDPPKPAAQPPAQKKSALSKFFGKTSIKR